MERNEIIHLSILRQDRVSLCDCKGKFKERAELFPLGDDFYIRLRMLRKLICMSCITHFVCETSEHIMRYRDRLGIDKTRELTNLLFRYREKNNGRHERCI